MLASRDNIYNAFNSLLAYVILPIGQFILIELAAALEIFHEWATSLAVALLHFLSDVCFFVIRKLWLAWTVFSTYVLYPLFTAITSCVSTVTRYLTWITTVSANALVALAQMGKSWIKDRVLKAYPFFHLTTNPFVRLTTTTIFD